MWPALDAKLARYKELETQLSDPTIAGNPHQFNAVNKEYAGLGRLVKPYLEYQELTKAVASSEELAAAGDPEMTALAEEELGQLRPKVEALKTKIEDKLLEDPTEDFDSIIMEVRAGTGGDEAALFAGELYEMYVRYARTQRWSIDEISASQGDAGGMKEVVFSVKGDGVYRQMKFESGGHRVQRVPKTETQGRVHTSLATVGVMPEPDEVQIDIKPADLEIEVMRAGGAGGQHVNKTESAVRIWYKKGTPDQIEVKCQDGRSQHKNKDQAMRVLRGRVFEAQQSKLHRERSELRKNLIGGGDRNERIRTYNFPQNRCTDHRIEFSLYKLDTVMAGDLDLMIQPMKDAARQEKLAAAG
jgi:peptide chain release factor 1